MINNILDRLGIAELNDMQKQVSTSYNGKNDLVILSPTGSGKTLAFSLVVQERLKLEKKGIQSLIVVPTRELALQIEQVIKRVTNTVKVTCIYGGNDSRSEKQKLVESPQILIGTPGRIIYHADRERIDLSTVETLVLDEFDKSLEFGFHDQMAHILSMTDAPFHILTSATSLESFPEFLTLNDPLTINYLNDESYNPDITFKKVTAKPQYKLNALFQLICKIGSQRILIFCNHRDAVNYIGELLADRDIIHDVFHGGLEQFDRELAIIKFRNNTSRILLTTDLAARGLDIPEVDAIIHYQLPSKEDAFIHRNGRTARMHAKGTVYSILKTDDNFVYLPKDTEEEELSEQYPLPENTPMTTLMFNAGKKDKVNKIDIVGFLLNLPSITKEDVGMIEVKDKHAFAAVSRKVVNTVLQKGNNSKIKGNKIKISRS